MHMLHANHLLLVRITRICLLQLLVGVALALLAQLRLDFVEPRHGAAVVAARHARELGHERGRHDAGAARDDAYARLH